MNSKILQIRSQIISGKSSARAEVEKSLAAAREDEGLHALLEILPDYALQKADEIDAQIAKLRAEISDANELEQAVVARVGRLAGVPYVAKDNFLTKVGHTTAAARILENFQSPIDATAIEKLDDEGAILIGKANLDAFAHGGSTENSAFGATKNAADQTRVAGGSSGGSAVVVAKNIVPFALGSDTGGSIREPASFNGVVGLKPTYGMISRYGVVAMASSTDVVGTFTQNVADAEILSEILAGQDGRDGNVHAKFFRIKDKNLQNKLNNRQDPDFNFTIIPIENRGYIMMETTNIAREFDFPPHLAGLTLKKEFHITLMKLELGNLDENTIAKIDEISQQAGVNLREDPPQLTGEFLLADDGDKRSILAQIDFPALENWQKAIREILPDATFSVPHITLYTKTGDGLDGVALNSAADFTEFTSQLDVKSEEILRNKLIKINTYDEVISFVQKIVKKAVELKNKYTDDSNSPVYYGCIFCQSDEQFTELIRIVGKFGKEIENHGTGPLFQVEPFPTVAGNLQLIRIRKFDKDHPEWGDADFKLEDYEGFKKKYLGADGFKLMERPNSEMLELMEKDFPVRIYFTKRPIVDERLGIENTKFTGESQKLKIGLIREFMGDGVDAEVKQKTLGFAEKLRAAGHEVTEVDLPMSKYALAIYYIVVPAELSSNLARFDGVRYGMRAGVKTDDLMVNNTNRFDASGEFEGLSPTASTVTEEDRLSRNVSRGDINSELVEVVKTSSSRSSLISSRDPADKDGFSVTPSKHGEGADVARDLSRGDGAGEASPAKGKSEASPAKIPTKNLAPDTPARNLSEVYGSSRNVGFVPENKRRLMIGAFVLSSGYFDAYYLQAQKARTLLIREFDKLFEKYDFLIGPVVPTPAFKLGENVADPLQMYLADIMTTPASLAGLPAISLPNGANKNGLPIGVQIIGQQKDDARLLALAKEMEK